MNIDPPVCIEIPEEIGDVRLKTQLFNAALAGKSDIMQQVLERCQLDEINSTLESYNALHVLILCAVSTSERRWRVEAGLERTDDLTIIALRLKYMPTLKDLNEKSIENEEVLECVRLLLAAGINFNLPDCWYRTAVWIAAQRNLRGVVQLILNQNWNQVDVDYYVPWDGKTARKVIEERGLYKEKLPDPPISWDHKKTLFRYLMLEDESSFVDLVRKEDANLDDGINTLLQLACKRRLIQAVCRLLELGADIEKTIETNPNKPRTQLLFLIKELAEHLTNPSILVETVRKLFINESFITTKISKNTLSTLLDRFKGYQIVNLDDTDEDCKANQVVFSKLFYYAITYGQLENSLKILDMGLHLGSRDVVNDMLIKEIDESALRKHLDDCISYKQWRDHTQPYFDLNYGTLVPNEWTYFMNEKDKNFDSELEVVSYIASNPKLNHLMLHPLIFCLLMVKNNISRNSAYLYLGLSFLNWLILFLCVLITEKVFWTFVRACCISLDAFEMMAYFTHFGITYKKTLLLNLSGVALIVSNLAAFLSDNVWLTIMLLTANLKFFFAAVTVPSLSIYVIMLKIVFTNFSKHLAFFSILLVTFATGFFLLLGQQPFFDYPLGSLFRTLIMFTGDFGLDQISFPDIFAWIHVLFIAFVLVVALTLYNLINGLAITDMHEIRSRAEILVLVEVVKRIHCMEKTWSFYKNSKTYGSFVFRFLRCVFRWKSLSVFSSFGRIYNFYVMPCSNGRIRVNGRTFRDENFATALGDWLRNDQSFKVDSQSDNNRLMKTIEKRTKKIEEALERLLNNQKELMENKN